MKVTIPEVKVHPTIEIGKLKKRIGILGGTFNPPHLGHLILAQQVKESLGLDKVMFMPDNIPPHVDKKEAISAEKRMKMLELSVFDNPSFGIETIELKRGGISYTYDTIRELYQLHPENEYYFIIGGDMVNYLPTWHNIEQLVKLIKFVGVERKGYLKNCKYPILWVDTPLIEISSTVIRKKVRNNESIHYLVNQKVEEYILKEGLYHE